MVLKSQKPLAELTMVDNNTTQTSFALNELHYNIDPNDHRIKVFDVETLETRRSVVGTEQVELNDEDRKHPHKYRIDF